MDLITRLKSRLQLPHADDQDIIDALIRLQDVEYVARSIVFHAADGDASGVAMCVGNLRELYEYEQRRDETGMPYFRPPVGCVPFGALKGGQAFYLLCADATPDTSTTYLRVSGDRAREASSKHAPDVILELWLLVCPLVEMDVRLTLLDAVTANEHEVFE